ncbi:glycosyltransferase family 4 protein [Nocardioides sp. BYT-33-1]|uniref:glycosyltransferase family 4 protein n=1 Tax=Nocardioides sp. BYT-33-1 TaxID=3416952 RepID=UPI003F53240A
MLVVRAADQIGGLETVVRDAATGLDGGEFQVTLAVVGDGPVPAIFGGLDVVTAANTAGLRAAMRSADVIHLHSPTLLDWSARLLWRGRRRRTPILVTLHLPSEPRGRHTASQSIIAIRRVLKATALRLCGAQVYAPSRAAASLARRRLLGIVAVRPLVQGVRDRGDRPPPAHRGLAVAFVGRMVEQKRPLTLLEAVADARARGVEVRIDFAGDGPLLAPLKDQARARGLTAPAVRFHGHLADPTDVLAAADLLVLPSTAEGCPIVVMEAAALGRASLVRRGIEGVDEILPGAHFTVDAHADARAIASRLGELAAERDEVIATGRRARAAFESTFSLTSACERYASVYRRAWEGNGR